MGRPAYCGWHHSLAGILCSLSEKDSWAAACIHPSLLPDGGCNVMTNCFNLLLPWPPNQGGLSPCPWSWINLLPSFALVRVFSHSNENETKTAGQGINKSRERHTTECYPGSPWLLSKTCGPVGDHKDLMACGNTVLCKCTGLQPPGSSLDSSRISNTHHLLWFLLTKDANCSYSASVLFHIT